MSVWKHGSEDWHRRDGKTVRRFYVVRPSNNAGPGSAYGVSDLPLELAANRAAQALAYRAARSALSRFLKGEA